MGINPNQISITDITGLAATEGSVILSKNNGDHTWSSNSTGSLKLPAGTTAQRNTAGQNGYLRFNTDTKGLEVYSEATLEWKGVGQLALDGTLSAPGISFSNEKTTGFYRPNPNQLALVISNAQRHLWTTTGETVTGNLTVTGSISAASISFVGANAALAAQPTQTLTLNNAATNVAVGGGLTYSASATSGMLVDYILKRGTNFRVGTLTVANSTTTANIAERATAQTVDIGVTFGVNVSSGNVIVTYTTTNTGVNITGKFSIRKWDSF
ncbi:MAG: hypothetical protein M0R77_16950 [Gammaproteobacteria bacterium]|nr:hypothetical protein [Gammaproteobacteria bacterium]